MDEVGELTTSNPCRNCGLFSKGSMIAINYGDNLCGLCWYESQGRPVLSQERPCSQCGNHKIGRGGISFSYDGLCIYCSPERWAQDV